MPRTIFRPTRFSSADARDVATCSHWTQGMRRFRTPGKVRRSETPTDRPIDHAFTCLVWRPPRDATAIVKPLAEVKDEDIRQYCFKDCAVYLVGSGAGDHFAYLQLYDKIYRRWFPTRAEDVDISHESFFCLPMEFQIKPDYRQASSKEILDFHEILCSKLDEEVPKLPDDPPRRHPLYTAENFLQLPTAQYKLRESFRQCFIVLHMDHGDHSIDGPPLKDRGVTIVWRQEDDAVRHGCVPDPDRGIAREEVEDLGTAQAYRCSLDEAMRLVVSTDPERRTMKREWHGYFQEWLGESEDVSVELCQCSRCQPHLYPKYLKRA